MTAAIGAFFTDLDLDIYHAAPRRKTTIVLGRWGKTLVQSATVVFVFLIPMFIAFARQYDRPMTYYPIVLGNLALLLSIPVTLASLTIVLLVRWFPVRRVHQIVATIAILVLTITVVAFRVSRPERLFTEVRTDNLVAVLQAIELPSIDLYPGLRWRTRWWPSTLHRCRQRSSCSRRRHSFCSSSQPDGPTSPPSFAQERAWLRWPSARSR
jgi:hypothetical protein